MKSALRGTCHPTVAVQSIEEFCVENKVTSAMTLYQAIYELALIKRLVGDRLFFPCFDAKHDESYTLLASASVSQVRKLFTERHQTETLNSILFSWAVRVWNQLKTLYKEKRMLEQEVTNLKVQLDYSSRRVGNLEGIINGLQLAKPKKSANIITSTLFVRLSDDENDDPVFN